MPVPKPRPKPRASRADTLARYTEHIIERLAGISREEQRLEVVTMLRHHLWARAAVNEAFRTARDVTRTVRRRGAAQPAIAGVKSSTASSRDGYEMAARLVIAHLATIAAKIEAEADTADPATHALTLLAALESHSTGELGHIYAHAAERAGELIGWCYGPRECARGVAISMALWFSENREALAARDRGEDPAESRLIGFRRSDFSSYMLAAMDSKQNVPQALAATVLALLGFSSSEIHKAILEARRALDPHASIDRAQIRKLTASARGCSAQRPTART